MKLTIVIYLIIGQTWASEQISPDSTNAREGKSVSVGTVEGLVRDTFLDKNKLPGKPNGKGQRCIKKIVQVEETEYDRGMECHHTFKKKCHVTYVTDYVSAPEKKCDTTFKKNCHITFKATPRNEKVKKCYTPLKKICGEETVGPEVCKKVFETHCETKYKNYDLEQDVPVCEHKEELRCKNVTVQLLHIPEHEEEEGIEPFAVKEECEKWPIKKCTVEKKKVTKVHPKTKCEKIPREVCSKSNCKAVPGDEVCHEENQILIQNIPQEDCDLEPEENCRVESALVPKLLPKKNCVKIPKEVCVNTKTNPRKIRKPILKEWCYTPKDFGKTGGGGEQEQINTLDLLERF